MTNLPPVLDWAELVVGTSLGPYSYYVSDQVTRRLRAALGEVTVAGQGPDELAPASLLTFPFLQLIETWRRPRPGTVHAQQEFELLAPLRVGATLTVRGVLTEVAERRDRRFFVVTASAEDERGSLVARSVTRVLYPAVDITASP